MKKITYIAQSETNLLSDYANTNQVINTCNALCNKNFSIDLITVNQKNDYNFVKQIHSKHEKIFFSIKEIKYRFFFKKQFFHALFIAFKYFSLKNIIYTRSDWVAIIFTILGKNVIFESHNFIKKRFTNYLFKILSNKNNLKIVTISNALKSEFLNIGFTNNVKTIPDSVDLNQFSPSNKNESRNFLKIDLNKKIVLYSGALRVGRGVSRIISIAKQLPKIDFYIFGGRDLTRLNHFRNIAKSYNNIHFFGFVKSNDLINYMNACDIFLMPHQDSCDIIKYTSPLKLFEYMAMKKPIIASDFPVFREILENNINGILVDSNSTQDFCNQIELVLNDNNFSTSLSNDAHLSSKKYSWDNRAESIIIFLNEKN